MTVEVIETKRHPPIWSVKAGNRYAATFSGANARAKAETYAAALGNYTVREKPPFKRRQWCPEMMAAK